VFGSNVAGSASAAITIPAARGSRASQHASYASQLIHSGTPTGSNANRVSDCAEAACAALGCDVRRMRRPTRQQQCVRLCRFTRACVLTHTHTHTRDPPSTHRGSWRQWAMLATPRACRAAWCWGWAALSQGTLPSGTCTTPAATRRQPRPTAAATPAAARPWRPPRQARARAAAAAAASRGSFRWERGVVVLLVLLVVARTWAWRQASASQPPCWTNTSAAAARPAPRAALHPCQARPARRQRAAAARQQARSWRRRRRQQQTASRRQQRPGCSGTRCMG
jgi:hypothetical protein